VGGEYFEFTCLPTLASDILYVDDFHELGAFEGLVQTYLDPAFKAVLPEDNQPDRYDVNAPYYGVGNDLSTRALQEHLIAAYSVIIWDSGNMGQITISDGRDSDKYNECALLNHWLDNSTRDVGLWIMGNDVAWDLGTVNTPYGNELMAARCGVQLAGLHGKNDVVRLQLHVHRRCILGLAHNQEPHHEGRARLLRFLD